MRGRRFSSGPSPTICPFAANFASFEFNQNQQLHHAHHPPYGHSSGFLLLLLTICCGTGALAQEIGQREKDWLKENTKAPETSIAFLLTLDRARLDLNTLEPKSEKPDPDPNDEAAIRAYTQTHPFDSHGYILLHKKLLEQGKREEAFQTLDFALKSLMEKLDSKPEDYEMAAEAVNILLFANQMKQVVLVLDAFIDKNPDHAEALSTLAIYESLMGELKTARERLDKAYGLAPKEISVFIGEFMFQLSAGLIQLQQADPEDEDAPVEFKYSTSLLDKAIKDDPQNTPAQLVKHSLSIMAIFLETVSSQADDFKEERVFQFDTERPDRESLDATEKYLSELLLTKPKNMYLPMKLMVITNVLQNDHATATKFYEVARQHQLADIDLFRIMAISAFRKADFEAAAGFIEAGLDHKDDGEIRLLLARFLSIAKQHAKALETVVRPDAEMSPDLIMGKLAYGIRAGNWELVKKETGKYTELNPKEMRPDLAYYFGVAKAMEGKKEEAKALLEQSKLQSYYKESADEITEKLAL